MNEQWDGKEDKKMCYTSEGTETEELEWKALPLKWKEK